MNGICYMCKNNNGLENSGCCHECRKIRSLKYYHANKDKLNRLVECEICNVEMKRPAYYNHIKTIKHLKLKEFTSVNAL